jgi:hypothetical protein
MRVRLIPDKGGDGTVHRIIVINDTGSARLSLRDTDLHHLGNRQGRSCERTHTKRVHGILPREFYTNDLK